MDEALRILQPVLAVAVLADSLICAKVKDRNGKTHPGHLRVFLGLVFLLIVAIILPVFLEARSSKSQVKRDKNHLIIWNNFQIPDLPTRLERSTNRPNARS